MFRGDFVSIKCGLMVKQCGELMIYMINYWWIGEEVRLVLNNMVYYSNGERMHFDCETIWLSHVVWRWTNMVN